MVEKPRFYAQRGLTLMELTVVLLIMIALAGTVVPYVGGIGGKAMCQTTDATLHAVKEAIMGGSAGAGFYGDQLGLLPTIDKGGDRYALHALFSAYNVDATTASWPAYNVKTAVGWRGPYLTTGMSLDAATVAALDSSFSGIFDSANPVTDAFVHIDLRAYDGADADAIAGNAEAAHLIHALDAWHRPVVLQVPFYDDDGAGPNPAQYHPEYARLVSAGPGGGIEPGAAAIDTRIQDRDAAVRGDDRVLFLRLPDPKPGGNLPCVE